jgi:hypothetical protein
LGFGRSILKVAPVWAIKFQSQLFLGEKAAAPKTEPAGYERYDVSPNGHARISLLHVFNRTDAYSNINVRDEKAPRYILKIEAGVQVIDTAYDDIGFFECLDGCRFRDLCGDAATLATTSNAPHHPVHNVDLLTLEPDIQWYQTHQPMPVRALDVILVDHNYPAYA